MTYSGQHNLQQSQKLDSDVLFIGEHEKFLFFNLPSVRSQTHLKEENNGRYYGLG